MKKNIKDVLSVLKKYDIVKSFEDINITDVTDDSRDVVEGSMFFCVDGYRVSGYDYIESAIKNGAVAIVVDRKVDNIPEDVVTVTVSNVKEALQKVVPYFFDYPANKMKLFGITGTNGKTTVTFMLKQIYDIWGVKSGIIGTIDSIIGNIKVPSRNTTPDVVELQKTLYKMHENNIAYVFMEVSSHALALNRIAGCEFDVAAITNITQEHLDFHKTLEDYIEAKSILFTKVRRNGYSIVNIDDNNIKVIDERTSFNKITYGKIANADIYPIEEKVTSIGTKLLLSTPEGNLDLDLSILGDFNIYNAMTAVGIAIADKVPLEIIKQGLESFKGVKGRFEVIEGVQNYKVIVDYAHTPDGLEQVLLSAKNLTKGRLITVFGCGGDRDKKKRPVMGSIAEKLSDFVFLTSDNPRSENPNLIIDDIKKGMNNCKKYEIIVDRKDAIKVALDLAKKDDTILIAGKGHETYQILANKTIFFDDSLVARTYLNGNFVMSITELLVATNGNIINDVYDDIDIFNISTDSRFIENASAFLALKGEFFDGHDFLKIAVENGARLLIVERKPQETIPNAIVLLVEDTLKAYQDIAMYHRKKYNIPVIAVTGSNGKTSTKDLIYSVLSSSKNVLRTEANFNNEIGLPKTLLKLNKAHQIVVLEMGMRGLNQIKRLCEIAKPTIGVITNVENTHIELLGNIENIAKAKQELLDSLGKESYAVLNYDNEYVRKMSEVAKGKVLFYGIDDKADVVASNISQEDLKTKFTCSVNNEHYNIEIPFLGIHNVYNALCAICVANILSIDKDDVIKSLKNAKVTAMRQDIQKIGSIIFIDDTYNASPASMRASLSTLKSIPAKRYVAILGDMLELGEDSNEEHRKIGEYAADIEINAFFAIGEKMQNSFTAFSEKNKSAWHFNKPLFAVDYIMKYIQKGDCILFKASRGIKMEDLLAIIKAKVEQEAQ